MGLLSRYKSAGRYNGSEVSQAQIEAIQRNWDIQRADSKGRAEVTQYEAAVARAQKNLRKAVSSGNPAKIKKATRAVTSAQAQLETARKNARSRSRRARRK